MNKKVIIRCVSKKDIPDILEIYLPFIRESAVTFEVDSPSEKEMWERISIIIKELPYIVCEVDKKNVGYAYASNHRIRYAYKWSKEVSVYGHPDFREKQIASVLYSILFEILKIQGVVNLLAGITLPNSASIKFHEKKGFKKIGEYSAVGYKLGKWHDVGWWELNLNPMKLSPLNNLIPFLEIRNPEVVENEFLKGQEKIFL